MGRNEMGEFPAAEEESDDDETGATGATGADIYGSSSTGSTGATGTVDLGVEMAMEARSKKNSQQERAKRRIPVSDEMLGTSTKPRGNAPTAARIAASLRKGCDFHNSGVLWCESLGRCFEPHKEDSACL